MTAHSPFNFWLYVCRTLVGLPLALLLCNSIFATDSDPLFADTSLVDITLSGPFTTINRERQNGKEYEGGTLTYMDNGQEVSLEAKFEVRGNFRLREDICRYAQLWVDLDKDEVAGTLFENQNRLKLIVQCRDSDTYQRYLVREHQAYQFFNTLTDLSFYSRLVNVNYVDTDRDRSRTHLGVFIEHKDRVAFRNGLDNVDLNRIDYTDLDPQQANLVDMFMLMIANTDYSIISAPEEECCHNAKLFQPPGMNRYFPAPYDFDSSGYVDARYAEPNSQLRIRSVRQRLYRGFCFPREVVDATLDAFRQQQSQILAIAADTTWMDEDDAEKSVEYLQDFYAIINDPEDLEDDVFGKCRG